MIFGNVIICDAVYTDRDSNKSVLAGVYSGNITLGMMPSVISVSLYAEYFPEKDSGSELEFQFFANGAHVGGATVELVAQEPGIVSMVVIPGLALPFTSPGKLEIRAAADGSEPTVILSKDVLSAATFPSASPPPS